jgi:hypothetical protein
MSSSDAKADGASVLVRGLAPEDLEALADEAREEHRSRNGHLVHVLSERARAWMRSRRTSSHGRSGADVEDVARMIDEEPCDGCAAGVCSVHGGGA